MTLRALRQNKMMNQAEFWSRVGITQSGGSRYENGNREPPEPVRMLLAIAYGTKRERAATLRLLTNGAHRAK